MAAGYNDPLQEQKQVEAQQLGLKPSTWKNIGKATMAPAFIQRNVISLSVSQDLKPVQV